MSKKDVNEQKNNDDSVVDEHEELRRTNAELTNDLQRVRADFENYRKRSDIDKDMARASGKVSAIMAIVPIVDNIERALAHVPADLSDNDWVASVVKLRDGLYKSLAKLDVHRINAAVGSSFDPHSHEAISMDDDAEGEHEVIAEELQAGYRLGNDVIRHSMVRVTRA